MMEFALWLALCGGLLLLITLGSSRIERLPLSLSMLILVVGVLLGPFGLRLSAPDIFESTVLIERLSEVIVLVSLFTSGLKMSAGLHDRRWWLPLRLAVVSMVVTVGLISAAGVWLIGLPLGAAVLLGAVLAPTDPVLATEVQVTNPTDRDRLRFALTGEGGLNDGTAFPFVMLGLGLLGLHEIGENGWRWVAVDLVWATFAGLAVGGVLGKVVGQLVLHLRRVHGQAVGQDNFLAMGLIGLAYGIAVLAHGYGFLAVFAAGLALRHTEVQATRAAASTAPGGDGLKVAVVSIEIVKQAEAAAHATGDGDAIQQLATDPKHASAFMAHAVMSFNEQLDRVGAVAGVLTIGLLLWAVPWIPAAWWFVPLMLLVIRPLAVAVGLTGSRTSKQQRRLIAWFGIRGIGSIYYLTYAMNHGLDPGTADLLVGLTMAVVVTSIVVHGTSVTPLMQHYRARRERRRAT